MFKYSQPITLLVQGFLITCLLWIGGYCIAEFKRERRKANANNKPKR